MDKRLDFLYFFLMGRFVAAELFKSKNENRPIKDLIRNFDKNSSDSPGNRDLINNI